MVHRKIERLYCTTGSRKTGRKAPDISNSVNRGIKLVFVRSFIVLDVNGNTCRSLNLIILILSGRITTTFRSTAKVHHIRFSCVD